MEERHVIVSCDQLGETLRAAPTLLEGLTPWPGGSLAFHRKGFVGLI